MGQFLVGDKFQPYDHAEVYIGQADATAPYGYTCSAYPSNGKLGLTGKRALPCRPSEVPGAYWSSGIIQLTDKQRAGIVAWCQEHPDVLYSFADYGYIAEHRLLHVKAARLQELIEDTGHMICSYYADKAFNAGGGYHLFTNGRWEGDVTPGDLVGLLQAKAHLGSFTP